ncbi:MAG: flagellar hook-associated protein FlgK [Hyphomicrobiaceae bacterium]|nr:flagellar hook-associated protein FlgK [Hyphomicrobiaceae bacterium]
MGISSAVNSSLSGLRYTQQSLDIIANNIANADSAGYTRKTLVGVAALAGDRVSGVRSDTVSRELDTLIQRQTRTEIAATSHAEVVDEMYSRLDILLGQPGSETAFDTLFNNLTGALQTLMTTPDSSAAQQQVVRDAEVLTQVMQGLSADIQVMRTEAEQGIADAVRDVNTALHRIEQINVTILSQSANSQVSPDLLDERDRYIDQLAELIDIRTVERDSGSVAIYTASGTLLFDHERTFLEFDQYATLSPTSQYSADPAERTVGTVGLRNAAGYTVDLIATDAIRSGKIAAYVELRDETLVEMQERLDELAHQMMLALSNRTEDSTATPAPIGGADGRIIDTAGIQPGNSMTLTYEELPAGTQRTVTLFHVTDASQLPLSNDLTPRNDDTVIGVDLTDPVAVNAALAGTGLTAGSSGGTLLHILDDGAGATRNVLSLSGSYSVTDLEGGVPELALFTDGSGVGSLYTGSLDGGSSRVGLAARIEVNSTVAADPGLLQAYGPSVASADVSRPELLYERLTNLTVTINPSTGIGANGRPYSASIAAFAREIVNQTAAEAQAAQRTHEGQNIVLTGLQKRQDEKTGVSMDRELALLTGLQNSYAANARVLTVAREMIDTLMRM